MRKNFFLVAAISLVFVACNKDGDIVLDNEDQENNTPEPSPENPSSKTGYSVIEYTPAPGQFINDATIGFNDITSPEEACEKAMERLENNLFVSLGGWGGYIIVKFDKSVTNSGGYDFSIGSNTFDTSNEPGIVWVMEDSNKNGKADDTWYELKGSFFGQEGYERNYWVTYTRPEPKKDTPWIDSNGETGVVAYVAPFHSQDYYYPDWILTDSFTYYGSRLPLRALQDEITGQWQNPPFEWGYVDNSGADFSKENSRNYFKISDAVTSENLPADLKEIDFVKVQTAINGSAGILGENSTEVTGFFIE